VSFAEVDRDNALFLASGEPETLDPAKWLFGPESAIGDLYSGLVRLDTNLRPIPDLAERWEISDDGTVYTFYLRRDVTFHNGKSFTAQDVKYSWERALRPETESNTAPTYMGDIIGASEVAAGEADEISGLRILDDHTLEVTLDARKDYFLYKLAYSVSWIVDSETVDEIETAPNGTGPFMLSSYDKDEALVLARYPNYHLGDVSLEYVVYLINPGFSQRLYEAGDIDLTYINEDLVDRANDPSDPLYGTVYEINGLCTDSVLFDVSQPPFDDLLVRRAFALAIDKERYIEVVEGERGVMARGLYPPGLPGHNPDAVPLGYDPEEALQSLNESSYGGPASLPEVVMTVSGAGLGVRPSAAVLIQMWEDALGVTIGVEQLEFDSYYDEIYAGDHGQILFRGWCADYPDPENFADVLFHSGSLQNFGHYNNPEVDALLEEARSGDSFETRLALYQEIEQTLIDDAVAVFTSHSQTYYMVMKPYVHGYASTAIGVAQNMNVSID
jgi:oligopeptide transport system substrate-binding protein